MHSIHIPQSRTIENKEKKKKEKTFHRVMFSYGNQLKVQRVPKNRWEGCYLCGETELLSRNLVFVGEIKNFLFVCTHTTKVQAARIYLNLDFPMVSPKR